jgi:hypothetical protein
VDILEKLDLETIVAVAWISIRVGVNLRVDLKMGASFEYWCCCLYYHSNAREIFSVMVAKKKVETPKCRSAGKWESTSK